MKSTFANLNNFLLILLGFLLISEAKSIDSRGTEDSGESSGTGGAVVKATDLLYLEDTYQYEGTGTILAVGHDEKRGAYLVLDQTIAYPQGGGQPSDVGTVQTDKAALPLTFVGFDGEHGHVRHFVTGDVSEDLIGQQVRVSVDPAVRQTNAATHTAGHLLGSVVGEIAPEVIAAKGYHFQDGPYVEFQGVLSSRTKEDLVAEAQARINQAIADGRRVTTELVLPESLTGLRLPQGFVLPAGKPARIAHIEGLDPVPCGGTHVSDLSQLGEVALGKVTIQQPNPKSRPWGLTKIAYAMRGIVTAVKR